MRTFASLCVALSFLTACDRDGAEYDQLTSEFHKLSEQVLTANQPQWIAITCQRLDEIRRRMSELALRMDRTHVAAPTNCSRYPL